MQRPRSSTAGPAGKLSVPRPVNLPSLKKVSDAAAPIACSVHHTSFLLSEALHCCNALLLVVTLIIVHVPLSLFRLVACPDECCVCPESP